MYEMLGTLKACAHWRGLPRGCSLARSSCGLVDHTRSKFHTLARSYMRSRESIDWRAERKNAQMEPRTNRPSVVSVYRCCVNSEPEFFIHFWPYIKYTTKKKWLKLTRIDRLGVTKATIESVSCQVASL